MEQYLKTIVESGGAVALAVVVWFELRALRKELISSLEHIGDKQQKQAEHHAILLEKQERAREDISKIRDDIEDVKKAVNG